MNDHYYTVHPTSEHDLRRIDVQVLGQNLAFDTDAGLFSRDELDTGTRVMLEALPDLHGRVLDLGCGWGAVGVSIKKRWPEIDLVMTDVNQRAVETSAANLRLNRLNATVQQGDGFEHISGCFDWVLTNPPIRTGKAAIYKLFTDARDHLNPAGHLVLVIRKQQGAPSALKFLKEQFESAEVIDRSAGFWVIDCIKGGATHE